MANQISDAERGMAALFEGLTRMQRMALLARLEVAGGALYRGLAADEKNAKAREKLLAAAGDEEKNGALLRLMSTPKDRCVGASVRWHRQPMASRARFSAPSAMIAAPCSSRYVPTARARSNLARHCRRA